LAYPAQGRIEIDGTPVADIAARIFVPPERRALGMVFQDYALWPHLSVGRNVAFPLEMTGVPRNDRAPRVAAALARVGLAGYDDRHPASLSGGQQQRVAIARAIVGERDLVLFDEPLSNLDRSLRENLVGEIGQLVRTLGLSALYVTHDHAEAFALADRVAVMDQGRILQIDNPERLVQSPAIPEVARFLNLGTLLNVDRGPAGWTLSGSTVVIAPCQCGPGCASATVLLPRAAPVLGHPDTMPIKATIAATRFGVEGHHHTVHIDAGATTYDLTVASRHRLSLGETVGVGFAPEHLFWFSSVATETADTERRDLETLEHAA